MLVQTKPVSSTEISIEGVSPSRFNFNQHFQLGGTDTTNLSRRCQSFYDSFQENSLHRCEMPENVKFIDVPVGNRDTLKQILKDVGLLREFWGLRVPIKLVGHMKDLQKHGEKGNLAVCGIPNLFLCRPSDNIGSLQLVKMDFISKDETPNPGTWGICSETFDANQVLVGPLRIFIACR